jgi:hypothetical protein
MRVDRRLGLLLLPWTLICTEIWVRWLDLDREMVVKTLLFQESDTGVQRVSGDPVLHYVLAPGTQRVGSSPWHEQVEININRHGARGSGRDLEKSPEVTRRLLFFGGSTVFGSGIQDSETLPAQLELALGTGWEVWNYGVPAYVPAQMARLAARKVQEIPGVDGVIFLATNRGRRAFLGGPAAKALDLEPFFAADPDLVAENFPAVDGWPPHDWLVRHVALYRWAGLWVWRDRLAHVHTNDTTRRIEAREMAALESVLAERNLQIHWAQWPPDLDRHPPPDQLADQARAMAPAVRTAFSGEAP